ncbi:UNVERIFIED_CONTAM: hypothetical protein PYX00_003932 [Menopon gallinae]|uniref:Uncharacterized protein n=1 Tax=Menopon gallinae TaxID=328185 RepID=A0AAW2I3E3_9NEOP
MAGLYYNFYKRTGDKADVSLAARPEMAQIFTADPSHPKCIGKNLFFLRIPISKLIYSTAEHERRRLLNKR